MTKAGILIEGVEQPRRRSFECGSDPRTEVKEIPESLVFDVKCAVLIESENFVEEWSEC